MGCSQKKLTPGSPQAAFWWCHHHRTPQRPQTSSNTPILAQHHCCQYLKCVANHQLVWNNPPNLKAKETCNFSQYVCFVVLPLAHHQTRQDGSCCVLLYTPPVPLFVFKFGGVVWRVVVVVVVVFEIHLQPPFIQLTTTPSATALCVISSNLRGRNVWNIIIVSPSGFLKDQVEFLFVSPCLPSSSTSGKTCWFVKLQYQQAKPKVQLNTLKTENSVKKSGWWLRESLVELWSNL